MFRRTLIVALLALGLMLGTAQAGILTGTFTIDIYQGYGGGLTTSSGVQADLSNPLIAPTYFKDQVTYTGAINFYLPSGGTNTVGAFLASGGGGLTGLSSTTSALEISAGGFANTTVFSITAFTGTGLAGTMHHDDGIGLYQNGSPVVLSVGPTVDIPTLFTLPAGNFQLIYVAANDLPEVLSIDVTRGTVPDGGTTLMLLGGALVGLGALRRKFRA